MTVVWCIAGEAVAVKQYAIIRSFSLALMSVSPRLSRCCLHSLRRELRCCLIVLYSAADHFGTLPGQSLKPISAYKVAAPDFNSAASLCVIVEGRSAVS